MGEKVPKWNENGKFRAWFWDAQSRPENGQPKSKEKASSESQQEGLSPFSVVSLRWQWNTVAVNFTNPTLADSFPGCRWFTCCGFQRRVDLWPSAVNSVSSLESLWSLKERREFQHPPVTQCPPWVRNYAGRFEDLASNPSSNSPLGNEENWRTEPLSRVKSQE